MNDIRRTILWVVFGFSMVLLWDQWQIHNGNRATFFPAPLPASQVNASAVGSTTASSGPNNSGEVPNPTAITPVSSNAIATTAVSTVAKEFFEIRTDVMKLTFENEGGSLVRSELLGVPDNINPDQNVVLLNNTPARVYMAQTGLIGGVTPGTFPTHKTPMTFSGDRTLADGQDTLRFSFTSAEVGGLQLTKTYTLRRGDYAMEVKHTIRNASDAPIAPQLYLQLVRDGNKPAGESWLYYTFTGPAVYTDAKKYQKVEFEDIKKKTADFEKQSSDGYIAMVQHYFASAWLLPDGMLRTISLDAVDIGMPTPDCCYRASLIAPIEAIAPGATQEISTTLFSGPQLEKKLEALAPGLELVKDYGWLTMLAKPLYWLLDWLHSWLYNWGWAIVALVLLIKVAFYWLNAKAYASMAKMKAVNPRIMEMRERLKDNPQQMQQEMLRIYREEKVNPMGGCFPILIQIPVFIALYWVLLSSVEMRNAPWILWISDLSTPDPYYILPILMTFTTLLQTALNPAPPDPLQAKLMWYMPLAFSIMFFFFPAGLVLYWITNNILSIAQQWIINVRMGVPPQFNLPKFNSKA
jgi:YidC/Oxa1 family membrane protein insertase